MIFSYNKIFTCLFILILFSTSGHCQDHYSENVKQKYTSFFNDIKKSNLTSKELIQLDIESQKLIQVFQKCEKEAINDIKELAEIREIDALNQSSSSGDNEPENVPQGTESINNKIDLSKKMLIDCRLKTSAIEGARVELLDLKRARWIDGLTVKHDVWKFLKTKKTVEDKSKTSDIIPLSRNALIIIAITLSLYFLLWLKSSSFYLEKNNDAKDFSLFKKSAKTLLKIYSIPILLSILFWVIIEPPHRITLMLLVTGLLIRDACLLLPIKMLIDSNKKDVFNKFIYFSTALIIVSAFVWQSLNYKNINAVGWFESNSILITPLFILTTVLFTINCYYYYRLLISFKDRYLPLFLMAFAILILISFMSTYAQAAQYLLVMSMSVFMVHMSLKIINSIRKIILRQRLNQLKNIENEQEKEATSYSFPFWISLMTSLASGVFALVFLSWVGGVSDEAYRQISFLYSEGFNIGSIRIIPSNIFTALILIIIFITLLIRVRHGIEYQWFSKSRLRKGPREVVSMLVWYLGITIITLMGLSVAGFDISNLAIIAGALSVGIGFGLQNIVSNFVSGLILLFERPVKPGDWVEVGSTVGFIEKVKIRATRIKTFDNAEILVPNSELLSHHVTNWTLSNSVGRIIIKVGVAYGSDTQEVKEILLGIAKDNAQVLNSKKYKSKVIFMEFGDSSLNFELRVMIRDIKKFVDVQSEINFKIDMAFRKAGISIPFPQRDLHLINSTPISVKQHDKSNDDDNDQNSDDLESKSTNKKDAKSDD